MGEPCAFGHPEGIRYVKGGSCKRCVKERYNKHGKDTVPLRMSPILGNDRRDRIVYTNREVNAARELKIMITEQYLAQQKKWGFK